MKYSKKTIHFTELTIVISSVADPDPSIIKQK
jgi:hypothetical protein